MLLPRSCNLYSLTKCQTAILGFTRSATDWTGTLPQLPSFPDTTAPVAWITERWRELVTRLLDNDL
jgi:hypothetical protein